MSKPLMLAALLLCAPAAWADGHAAFEENCASCHGADAEGIEGLAPPLHNADLWKTLGDNRQAYIAGVVTGGMSGTLTSKGSTYEGLVMPPLGYLDTATLVEITHYVLNEVNQAGDGPSAALITQYQANPPEHAALRKLRNGG
ncbi:c-type cytochrome [Chimaeribacter coloradensis]|nr:c-type cytochrome [Chimaeribacter coloradensis]